MLSLQLKAIFNTRKEIKTLLLLIHALVRVTRAALNQTTVQILSHEAGSLSVDQTRVTNYTTRVENSSSGRIALKMALC